MLNKFYSIINYVQLELYNCTRALQFLKFSCIVYSCIYNKILTIYILCIHNLFLIYRYLSCIEF